MQAPPPVGAARTHHLELVHCFDETRLRGTLGHVPPIEFETEYDRDYFRTREPCRRTGTRARVHDPHRHTRQHPTAT